MSEYILFSPKLIYAWISLIKRKKGKIHNLIYFSRPVDPSPSFKNTTSTGLSENDVHMPSWERCHRPCLSVARFRNRMWISWLFGVSSSSNANQLLRNKGWERFFAGSSPEKEGLRGRYFTWSRFRHLRTQFHSHSTDRGGTVSPKEQLRTSLCADQPVNLTANSTA